MALDKMTGNAGLNPTNPLEGLKQGPQGVGTPAGKALGEDFRKALGEALGPQGAMQPAAATPAALKGPQAAQATSSLKFSNHAIERMHSRGISIPPDEMKSIENAIAKAAQKGSKDTLVLAGDKALIVSVKNNTVVTVMDKTAMKENVFTNIDSTVVV